MPSASFCGRALLLAAVVIFMAHNENCDIDEHAIYEVETPMEGVFDKFRIYSLRAHTDFKKDKLGRSAREYGKVVQEYREALFRCKDIRRKSNERQIQECASMISKRVKRVLLLRVLKMAKEDYLQAKEDYLRSSRTLEKAEKQYAAICANDQLIKPVAQHRWRSVVIREVAFGIIFVMHEHQALRNKGTNQAISNLGKLALGLQFVHHSAGQDSEHDSKIHSMKIEDQGKNDSGGELVSLDDTGSDAARNAQILSADDKTVHSTKVHKSNKGTAAKLGESVTTKLVAGRRGGGALMTSGSFTMMSSNRAGNSEDEEDEYEEDLAETGENVNELKAQERQYKSIAAELMKRIKVAEGKEHARGKGTSTRELGSSVGNRVRGGKSGLKNAGKDCWGGCSAKQGRCSWCGTGYCCRKNWHDKSNGCDGSMGIAGKGHACVAGASAATPAPPSTEGYSLVAKKKECKGAESSSYQSSVAVCAKTCKEKGTIYFAYGQKSGRCKSDGTCRCLCEKVGENCRQTGHAHYNLYKRIEKPTCDYHVGLATRSWMKPYRKAILDSSLRNIMHKGAKVDCNPAKCDNPPECKIPACKDVSADYWKALSKAACPAATGCGIQPKIVNSIMPSEANGWKFFLMGQPATRIGTSHPPQYTPGIVQCYPKSVDSSTYTGSWLWAGAANCNPYQLMACTKGSIAHTVLPVLPDKSNEHSALLFVKTTWCVKEDCGSSDCPARCHTFKQGQCLRFDKAVMPSHASQATGKDSAYAVKELKAGRFSTECTPAAARAAQAVMAGN